MQRLHTFKDSVFVALGFSERPPIPSWAQPKIDDWARLLAVIERVERTPAALNRFKAEALVAGEWGLAPLPPPMSLEHADPEDSLIRSTPLDRYLPINWRLVSHLPPDEVPIKRSSLYGFQMILNQLPLDAMKVLQASELKLNEPMVFAHFSPDGRRAGLYIVRQGSQWSYVATDRWGETARRHDKHYFWFSGGLGELSHKKSNERFVSFDGIGGANCLMGADAIARAVERALQEKKP